MARKRLWDDPEVRTAAKSAGASAAVLGGGLYALGRPGKLVPAGTKLAAGQIRGRIGLFNRKSVKTMFSRVLSPKRYRARRAATLEKRQKALEYRRARNAGRRSIVGSFE